MIRVETGVATATRKLYSARGTLLGTITYPAEWDLRIRANGRVSIAVWSPISWREYLGEASEQPALLRTFSLFRHYNPLGEREGIRLDGLTLEEFEQQPGCSFSPGAGYLRGLIE